MVNYSFITANHRNMCDVASLLKQSDLVFDTTIEATIVAYDMGVLIGTCSYSDNIIKCFAVRKDHQGEGIGVQLISNIYKRIMDRGYEDAFVYTTRCNIEKFQSLGFELLAKTGEGVALLELGIENITQYLERSYQKLDTNRKDIASIIMNCNPFTNGHRYIIEKAASENQLLIVFVVEEDKSEFSFVDRMEMVIKGVADLENVRVVPAGRYLISSATFPNYFIKDSVVRNHAQGELDALIFRDYVAKTFKIKKRYVGTEPYCHLTKAYNDVLRKVLLGSDIELLEIQRLKVDDQYVSASKVRACLHDNNKDELVKYIPFTTYMHLKSKYKLNDS